MLEEQRGDNLDFWKIEGIYKTFLRSFEKLERMEFEKGFIQFCKAKSL